MDRLFIYLDKEVLKARRSLPGEATGHVRIWKGLEFEFTTSPLMMISWPSILPELPSRMAEGLLDLVGSRYPFSPYVHDLQRICPELLFTKVSEEWVFFGGSFNPWHKGHQSCLDLLPEEKVCFILPDRNPQKDLKSMDVVPTIIELVTKIKFGTFDFIAPTFLLDHQKNPTVDWIERLHQHFPEKKLSLLQGFDSLRGIITWDRSDELLQTLDTIYAVSRLEDDEEREKISAPIKKIAPDLKIVFLGRHDHEDLSSTQLRSLAGTR